MHSIAFQSSIADTRAKHLSHSACCCCCRVAAVVAAYREAINCASQHVVSVVVAVVAVACQKYGKEAPSAGDEELNLGFSCSCAFGIAFVSSRLHRTNRVQ